MCGLSWDIYVKYKYKAHICVYVRNFSIYDLYLPTGNATDVTWQDKQSNDRFFKIRRRLECNCHKCMINAPCRAHSLTVAARYKFIPFKFSAARAVAVSPGARAGGLWAGRSTITQVTKIDGKWADTVCPRRHQLPRPDGHRALQPIH